MKLSVKNLKVRVKLLLAFGSILFLTLTLLAVLIYSANQLRQAQKISSRIEKINALSLELDAYTSYFTFEDYKNPTFHTKKSTSTLESFFIGQESIAKHIDTLQQQGYLSSTQSLDSLHATVKTLSIDFNQLIDLFYSKGFKDFGLEGELRTAIHNVEHSSYPIDKSDMLMLRRHEKDFFLRKDLKYPKEFLTKHEEMIQKVLSNKIEEGKSEIVQNLEEYKEKFNTVVELEKQIGLDESEGLRASINKDLNNIHSQVIALKKIAQQINNSTENSSMVILIVVLGIQLILGILLAIMYSSVITKAVKQLLKAMSSLASGSYPVHLPVHSEDELGQTKLMFNQLLDRMKSASNFSSELGKGNLKAEYSNEYTSDVWAESLLKMQKALIDAKDKQDKINWTNYGSAQLNEILKHENEAIEILADKILKMLVQYLGANQGATYLAIEEVNHVYLDRIATYAYGKKKYTDQRIEFGQGLAGQCALEMEPIIITSVPSDYIKITSGLGEALPRFVAIIPLVIQNKTLGVIEFASFEVLEDYKIDFIKKISENIASILNNKKINENTKSLLEQANAKEMQLKSQEEELRQNTEEMQAVQEEMERQHRELQSEIESLKDKLSFYELSKISVN